MITILSEMENSRTKNSHWKGSFVKKRVGVVVSNKDGKIVVVVVKEKSKTRFTAFVK